MAARSALYSLLTSPLSLCSNSGKLRIRLGGGEVGRQEIQGEETQQPFPECGLHRLLTRKLEVGWFRDGGKDAVAWNQRFYWYVGLDVLIPEYRSLNHFRVTKNVWNQTTFSA